MSVIECVCRGGARLSCPVHGEQLRKLLSWTEQRHRDRIGRPPDLRCGICGASAPPVIAIAVICDESFVVRTCGSAYCRERARLGVESLEFHAAMSEASFDPDAEAPEYSPGRWGYP